MSWITIAVVSIIINLLLIGFIVFLVIKYLKEKRRSNKLVNELGSDSLEHYLNEIRGRGFDFVLKPKVEKKAKK